MITLLTYKTHLSAMKHLYRILAGTVILLPLLGPATCAAQKKPRSKLRALAVVELPSSARVGKDMELPSSTRLRAIAIFQNGEYQDATIYRMNPMPMALEPGTVYDVLQSGDSLGLLSIESVTKAKDDWLAAGRWKSSASQLAAKAALAPVQASLPGENDQRPRLKRGDSSSAAPQPAPTSTPAASQPAAMPVATPAPAEAIPPAAQTKPNTPSVPDVAPSQSDPNRPELRRRAPASESSTPATQVERKRESARGAAPAHAVSAHAPAEEGASLAVPVLKKRGHVELQFLAAISDASPYDTRSYKFPWIAAEQRRLTTAVEKQAQAELAAYAGKSSQVLVPGSFTSSVQAFDLDYDNDAELVLTAKCALRKKVSTAKATPLNAYITYVFHEESTGDLHKLFSEITDDDHLDVIGRMELIDAVDADGDGHAELLFHRLGASTQSFELYRAGRDQLWKLFEGAESQKN